MTIKSECHNARIGASLAGGVLVGYCDECNEPVVRFNRETNKTEWLDGKSPWTADALREVEGWGEGEQEAENEHRR